MGTSKFLTIEVSKGVSPTLVADFRARGYDVTLMGTSKPLTIGVDSRYEGADWVVALEAKGHLITLKDMASYDLVLGPNCARFMPGMEKMIEVFLKGARTIKYKGKKDA